jgi:Tol biopolymer transport system component
MLRRGVLSAVIGAIALPAVAATAQQVPPRVTLADFGDVSEATLSPNGRFVLQSTESDLRMYDVATRRWWELLESPAWSISWSPRGDMIAYVRDGDDGSEDQVWTMPVDPNTGRVRGPAQRVTIVPSESPTFSADERWIAVEGIDSVLGDNLSIVPATGGPARVLLRLKESSDAFWSTDGRTIYVSTWGSSNGPGSVLKVRVADGVTTKIRSRGDVVAGMTEDRRYLVLVPNENPIGPGEHGTVIDTAGREVGQFQLPAGRLDWDAVRGDSALVWIRFSNRAFIEIRPVQGGSARRLPLVGESDDAPAWSPDGQRIAFQAREGNRTLLALIDADGTNPHVYRDGDVLGGFWGVWGAQWSPDSRFVAFLSANAPRRLSVLDVATGAIRDLVHDDSIGLWRWRADSRAIVYRSRRQPGAGIYVTTLSGESQELLNWPIANASWQYVGDSSIFVRLGDTVAVLRPLGPGPVRRLSSVPPQSKMWWPVTSSDGRWVAGPWTQGGVWGLWHQLEVFSLETGARSVLDLPFNVRTYSTVNQFLPDNSSLLVFGWRSGEVETTLYRVPLDGSAPRAIAGVGRPRPDGAFSASASPDGRSVAYGVQPDSYTESLVLIDLRGAIPGATSRPPRR